MAALTALQRLMASPKTARFVETLRHADLPVNWADDPEIVSMAGDAYKELGTGSPFWKATFGNSKVVDEAGNPLTLYHGTNGKFSKFDIEQSRPNMDIQGAYFAADPREAQEYGDNVYGVYLNLSRPADDRTSFKALDRSQNNAGIKARQDLITAGYDGVNRDGEEFIAFHPTQIKSVNNRGTFNPADPNIYRGLIPMLAGSGALAAMAPGSAQASEAQAEWPKQAPDGRLIWPADMPGYRNTEPGLEAPLVDPVDIATAPIGMTTAAGKALAMAAEPGLAYGTDKALGALLGMFQRRRSTGGGGGA